MPLFLLPQSSYVYLSIVDSTQVAMSAKCGEHTTDPPVPQWREPTWPATTEPLELNCFLAPFSSIIASFTMPHILPRRRRPRLLCIAFTCFSLAALTAPAGAIWPFSPKRFTGNALVAAGSMGLDSDQRVVAFGDFNGDQLCVVLSVLASLSLHHILWMLRTRI